MALLSLITRHDPFSSAPAQAGAGLPGSAALQPAEDLSLEAFNDLVLTYQDAAYNFACALVGDPDVAADITQKAFINAYLNLSKFHGPSFKSWLFKIIKNASVDEFRSASFRHNRSLEEMVGEDEWRRMPVEDLTPEKQMERAQREAAIHAALARLEEPYRTVIHLVDIEEMEYEEAAAALQVPVGTIKSRLARARMKFRAEMEKVMDL